MASRRAPRSRRYTRFLWLAAIGSLIPGVGLIASGRRRWGWLLLLVFAAVTVGGIAFVLTRPTGRLASYGGDRQVLLYAGIGLAGSAVIWLLIALVSHWSLEPRGLTGGRRLMGALTVVVAASIVVTPLTLGARAAFTQRDLIHSIAADEEETSLTAPVDIDKTDPWKEYDRVNVLLLGGDIGKGRLEEENGIRPDTQIVASIDTDSGDTTLISLPRNLGNVPFPADSPLHEAYPNGFVPPSGMPDPFDPNPNNDVNRDYLAWSLNAIWNHAPQSSGLDLSGSDANKWAVEAILGIDIHWYVLVTLDGFEEIIDALGGITVDVGDAVPIHYGEPDGTCVSRAEWIPEGEQELDGASALMYARSRCGADDYDRMKRQQCVMRAIIDRADPATLVSKYQRLAGAAKEIVKTDIDADLFPALIELGVKVQGASLGSISVDDAFFAEHGGTYNSPDYEVIHAFVTEILTPPNGDSDEPEPSGSGDETEPAEPPSDESDEADSREPIGQESPSDEGDEPDGGEPTDEAPC